MNIFCILSLLDIWLFIELLCSELRNDRTDSFFCLTEPKESTTFWLLNQIKDKLGASVRPFVINPQL